MHEPLWTLKGPVTGLLLEPALYFLPRRRACLWWVAQEESGAGRHEALVFTGLCATKRTSFLAYDVDLIQPTYGALVDLGQTPFFSGVCANLRICRSLGTKALRHFVR
jgi:hypothetical protein